MKKNAARKQAFKDIKKESTETHAGITYLRYSAKKFTRMLPEYKTVNINIIPEVFTDQVGQLEFDLSTKIPQNNSNITSSNNTLKDVTIRTLIALFAADVDIFLLKCKDQETDKRILFTPKQIRKQLLISTAKITTLMDKFTNIDKPIEMTKLNLDNNVIPNKLSLDVDLSQFE